MCKSIWFERTCGKGASHGLEMDHDGKLALGLEVYHGDVQTQASTSVAAKINHKWLSWAIVRWRE